VLAHNHRQVGYCNVQLYNHRHMRCHIYVICAVIYMSYVLYNHRQVAATCSCCINKHRSLNTFLHSISDLIPCTPLCFLRAWPRPLCSKLYTHKCKNDRWRKKGGWSLHALNAANPRVDVCLQRKVQITTHEHVHSYIRAQTHNPGVTVDWSVNEATMEM